MPVTAPPVPRAGSRWRILYADIDNAHILAAKNAYDPTGHYSRPDVLRLLFNPAPTPRVLRTERLDAVAVEFAEPIDIE